MAESTQAHKTQDFVKKASKKEWHIFQFTSKSRKMYYFVGELKLTKIGIDRVKNFCQEIFSFQL